MDQSPLPRQPAKSTWFHPLVLAPGVLGAAALVMAFLLGQPAGLIGLAGLAAILFAGAAAYARWLFVTGPLALGSRGRGDFARQAEFDQLARQFKAHKDSRPLENLENLRRFERRLRSAERLGGTDPLIAEIRAKSRELFESCLTSLRRAWQQRQTAAEMATEEARLKLLGASEQLLDEVARSVEHLGASVDQMQIAALGRGDCGAELAAIRSELDMGLEVARNVRQRLDQFDQRGEQRLGEASA